MRKEIGESEPIYYTECLSKIRKRVYQQIDRIRNVNKEKPNAEGSKQFWSNIWDNETQHERNAEWLRELSAKKENMKQNDIYITTKMIKEQVKKIPNWKSARPDGVQGYWLKKLTTSVPNPEYIWGYRLLVLL